MALEYGKAYGIVITILGIRTDSLIVPLTPTPYSITHAWLTQTWLSCLLACLPHFLVSDDMISTMVVREIQPTKHESTLLLDGLHKSLFSSFLVHTKRKGFESHVSGEINRAQRPLSGHTITDTPSKQSPISVEIVCRFSGCVSMLHNIFMISFVHNFLTDFKVPS